MRDFWFAMRPDAQAFDEIRIVTVPRWKESGLSGDEWRISAQTQFLRNGVIVHTTGWRNVETAAGCALADLMGAMDAGKGFFAGDGMNCDQEGCSEPATVFLKKKLDYDRSGNSSVPDRPSIRCFCDRHKVRGDCGLDDADRNYDPWEMPAP